MFSSHGPDGVLKLVDFGFAKCGPCFSTCHTVFYVPPEIIEVIEYRSRCGHFLSEICEV